ncbi:hypothetical protein [Nocardia abscessus]|uniref:hypothetical protein n=1 Tax=Nocardia abscessus TaxID=120957 RepID=UPI00245434D8|nr:hypothetical protein [Nocardia abscessus]
MTAKAIGFLRKDLTDDTEQAATTIRELADRVGYTLVEMLTPGDEIEPAWHLVTRPDPRAPGRSRSDRGRTSHARVNDGRDHRSVQCGHSRRDHPRSRSVSGGMSSGVRNVACTKSRARCIRSRRRGKLAIARTEGPLWMAVNKPQTWALVNEDGTSGEEFTVVAPAFGAAELHEGDAE